MQFHAHSHLEGVCCQVAREGTKKTVFTNYMELCKTMNRVPEHVQLFLLAELGTSGSLDGQQRLVVKGRFQPKAFEGVLRRYVNEYAPLLPGEGWALVVECACAGRHCPGRKATVGCRLECGRLKQVNVWAWAYWTSSMPQGPKAW